MTIAGYVAALAVLGRLSFAAESVRLHDLIATALANNPEVQAAQKRYEAARQRPSGESSLPDPTLSLGYASNGGPLPGQGLGTDPTSNIGVMVSQEFPYPGKRKLRGDIAAKEADAEFQQYQTVQLSVRSRVVQAFHRLHHAYAALEILAQGKNLFVQVIRVSEARYAAGKAAQQDIFKAQTQLSILETRIIRMEQDRRTAEAEINSLLNRTPGAPVGIPETLDPAPLRLSLSEVIEKAETLAPALKREQKMIERNELAVNLARKDFYPDYTVSGGYFNQGRMPPMYQFRIDIPLRLYAERKQRPALNAQVSRLTEARRNFTAAGQSLQFKVQEAYLAAQTSFRLLNLYADTILPQSALTVESSLSSYETGATDFLSVLTNLTTKVEAEERYHEEQLSYAIALARLEEITGALLGEAVDNK